MAGRPGSGQSIAVDKGCCFDVKAGDHVQVGFSIINHGCKRLVIAINDLAKFLFNQVAGIALQRVGMPQLPIGAIFYSCSVIMHLV